jgi:hypothetical protein
MGLFEVDRKSENSWWIHEKYEEELVEDDEEK